MSIKWVTLTTAEGGDSGSLRKNCRELERRVMKTWGTGEIESVKIDTTEGNGVLHLLWAMPNRRFVPQAWLSDQWKAVHGAPIVHIAEYRVGTSGRLSRYMVSQYMSGQGGAGVRISWSWKKTFTVPLKAAWRTFKRAGGFTLGRGMIEQWGRFLCGETVRVGGYFLSLWTWRDVRRLIEFERAGGGWAYGTI